MCPACLFIYKGSIKDIAAKAIKGCDKIPFIGIGAEFVMGAVMLDQLSSIIGSYFSVMICLLFLLL